MPTGDASPCGAHPARDGLGPSRARCSTLWSPSRAGWARLALWSPSRVGVGQTSRHAPRPPSAVHARHVKRLLKRLPTGKALCIFDGWASNVKDWCSVARVTIKSAMRFDRLVFQLTRKEQWPSKLARSVFELRTGCPKYADAALGELRRCIDHGCSGHQGAEAQERSGVGKRAGRKHGRSHRWVPWTPRTVEPTPAT